MARITFQKDSVKELEQHLHEAYRLGDVRVVRRIAVLLAIARGEGLSAVEAEWGIAIKPVTTGWQTLSAAGGKAWCIANQRGDPPG